MKTGIVILNYNCIDQTKELLGTIIDNPNIDEIVIVDNNSKDDINELELLSDKIHTIKNLHNGGYAAGNNVGFRYLLENTSCEIGFLANPDCLLNDEAITKVSDFLTTHQDYLLASPMREDVQYSDKTIQFWQCPKFHVCLFEGFFIYQKLHHRRERIISNRACERNDSSFIDVPVVPGSFFGVNMTLFRNVDLMDENTFLWYEENCLAKKAELSHYKEAILLDCKYIHNHKLKKKGKTLYSEYLKSKEFYCRKYLKLSSLSFGVLRVFDFISLIEHKTLNFFARLFRK